MSTERFDAQQRELEAAGWRVAKQEGTERCWEDPKTDHLYRQTAAHWLLRRRRKREEQRASEDG